MDSLELTILMPCLNEAETLATCIKKAKQFLTREGIVGEVLVADNGSTDGSQSIARDLGADVIHVSTKGYGAALKAGIMNAKGRYIIMGDADDSYNFLDLMPFINELRAGNQLVIGNRFQGGIHQGAMPFLNRYLGNPILSFIGRVFFKSKIGDFHCGLRGFDRGSFLSLGLQGDGMEFASEMVIKATLRGFRMAEVPTELHPDGRSRKPHLRPWRDGWRHLRLLLLFSPRWLFFYPGFLLMMLGLTLMGVLIQGPLVIGGVYFDIHTLLFSALFTILGLQAVCFALCAKLILRQKMGRGYTSHNKLMDLFTLERGILLGIGCVITGLILAFYAVLYWSDLSFGPLSPHQMMRMVIPATTAMMAGLQIIFTSFFVSLVTLHDQPTGHNHTN